MMLDLLSISPLRRAGLAAGRAVQYERITTGVPPRGLLLGICLFMNGWTAGSVLANPELHAPPQSASIPSPAHPQNHEPPLFTTAPELAPPPLPETLAVPPKPARILPVSDLSQINPALLRDTSAIISSNLNPIPKPIFSTPTEQQYEMQLAVAQRHRTEKNSSQAAKGLISLLESQAPERLKRIALIELALLAQQEDELPRAMQIFSQYLQKYPQDPSVPEVLLRQGLLYRQMGSSTLALSKFYAVMTSALNLRFEDLEYYKRLVLQAQTEIADTHFVAGNYDASVDAFKRLLTSDSLHLNRAYIQYKMILCLSSLGQHDQLMAQARSFISLYPESKDLAEVRFLLASALKLKGRNTEALQQVMSLLESQNQAAHQDPELWAYWRQRAGNEIANLLYKEGDYANALLIYSSLAKANGTPAWQLPALYQVGIVYERLHQPQKALENYGIIAERAKELASHAPPGLNTVIDMAKWRCQYLTWQLKADQANQGIRKSVAAHSADQAPTRNGE